VSIVDDDHAGALAAGPDGDRDSTRIRIPSVFDKLKDG
jgi:hypothetical protein